jgi:hypothetical protein
MQGGAWPGVVVVEITASGVLVEAPAEPPIPVGMVGTVDIELLRAQTVVEATYPHPDAGKTFYSVKVIEIDEGFMSALERCVRAKRPVVNVRRSCPLLVAMHDGESIARVPDPHA